MELLDEDGENRAVRVFLMVYHRFTKIESIKIALRRAGFDGCWPAWAESPLVMHLTKSAAQDWIRYLINLETKPVLYGFRYKTGPVVDATYNDPDAARAAWAHCIPEEGEVVPLYTRS